MKIMIKEFTYLFNLSLSTGIVPTKWKSATVIPIPKVKNSKHITDLRPISLLPLPGKVLEHIIHDWLMSFLHEIKLHSDKQFGFRPGVSTVDAIATLIEDIGFNLNDNKLTIATFIDFRKAFDTLNHNILLNKLVDVTNNSITLKGFKSYLTNRSQHTFLNGVKSTSQSITTGVPQASVQKNLIQIFHSTNLI